MNISGLTPLAARSLMFITTVFLAAWNGVMPTGTSVLQTSISVLMTATLPSPTCNALASSQKGKGMLGICVRCLITLWMSILSPMSETLANCVQDTVVHGCLNFRWMAKHQIIV